MSETTDNLKKALATINQLNDRLQDVLDAHGRGYAITQVVELMTGIGEFFQVVEDSRDAIDASVDELVRLEGELEGKNYELEMVKMEMEVYKSA